MSYPYDPNGSDPGWVDSQPLPPRYPAPEYGNPHPGSPYSGQPYGYGYPGAPKTNGMALGALITSLSGTFLCVVGTFVFFLGGVLGLVGAVVGAILGHVARGQIRKTGEQGGGMALTAIIVGWVVSGLYLIVVAVVIVFLFVAFGSSSSWT